jgi:bifunctional ADP-heptose synthase (sugar kinase/adenylyltransferase)
VILASLSFVDAVILFNEDTPYELIKMVQPDVLIKGADYAIKDIVGADIVQQKGGIVKTIEFLAGYSTTLTEEKIRNAKK